MSLSRIIRAAVLLATLAGASDAQDQWSWPERPQNLQVLSEEFSGLRLRPVMTGFTRSLGVRCSYCHVGEEGEPLSTYDFVSDSNPNKERARVMLRMLGNINEQLREMKKSGDQAVNMWCHTCHRGRPKPMTLDEELGSVYRAEGIEPAVAHYATLRNRFYGKGAYDFSEAPLNAFGYAVLQNGDPQGAIRAFTLATEQFPNSANAWDSLAEACLKAGDRAKAKEFYEKSLILNPKNRNAQQMLEKMAKEEQ